MVSITLKAADAIFDRSGANGASFEYLIKAQASAENTEGGVATAGLEGDTVEREALGTEAEALHERIVALRLELSTLSRVERMGAGTGG